jgi:hypothetical protein
MTRFINLSTLETATRTTLIAESPPEFTRLIPDVSRAASSSGYMLAISRLTRSSTERNGSLHNTVR